MGQSFGSQFTLVEVATDSLAGIPKKQLWAAAAKPDQAITLVLCAVPVGWTAAIADGRLTPRGTSKSQTRRSPRTDKVRVSSVCNSPFTCPVLVFCRRYPVPAIGSHPSSEYG